VSIYAAASARFDRVLLVMNFLPAVLLWRHDEVVVWLERQKRN
jgi:hypothetical protein